jgi:hypothetical protein
MSAVLVLTPLVISSWPAISAAVVGAAAAMGFSVAGGILQQEVAGQEGKQSTTRKKKVEAEVPNSEVMADSMTRGQKITIRRGDITIEIGQDERGACTVCASGGSHSDKELKKIAEEVAGRIVQQFAYHKLITELKRRKGTIIEEHVNQDASIQVRVRL